MPTDAASIAADLRQRAGEVVARARAALAAAERDASAMTAAADLIDASQPALPPLRGVAAKAATYITNRPGRTAAEISADIGCSADRLRHVTDVLKAHGYTVRTFAGGGYYPPQENPNRVSTHDFENTTQTS